MPARNYSNIALLTALASGITNVATSLTVNAATGWPIAPFLAVIDEGGPNEEIVLVGNKSGTTFSSLTRGFGGTSGVAHNATESVKHIFAAEDARFIWEHVHSGAGGDFSAQVSHDNLSGVSANDHHAQQHAIGGSDHSGTLDHGALADLLADDHTLYLKEKASGGTAAEVPEHTHAASSQGGTIDHGALTGLSDDDHPQYPLQTEFDDHSARHEVGGADAFSSYPRGILVFDKGAATQNIDSAGGTAMTDLSLEFTLTSTRWIRFSGTIYMQDIDSSGLFWTHSVTFTGTSPLEGIFPVWHGAIPNLALFTLVSQHAAGIVRLAADDYTLGISLANQLGAASTVSVVGGSSWFAIEDLGPG